MPHEAPPPEQLSLSVPTTTGHIGTVRNFVGSVGAHYGLTDEQIEDLKLAVSEICGNANESPADGRIVVRIAHNQTSLDVEVAGIGRTVPDDENEAHAFRWRLIDALIPDATFTPTDYGMAVRFKVDTPG
jgi:anti-sigma regulatory factor (Ser/Thr protein kinase)